MNLIASTKGSVKNYYLYNAHGDVVSYGSKAYKYDAFGNELAPNASDANPFRYAGEYFDGETETYYLRARYYDPSNGRFLSKDTVTSITNEMPNGQLIADPLSLNLYTYAHNNPVRYVDYSGNMAVAATVAATNFWNPIGWIAAGVLLIEVAVGVYCISVISDNLRRDYTDLPMLYPEKVGPVGGGFAIAPERTMGYEHIPLGNPAKVEPYIFPMIEGQKYDFTDMPIADQQRLNILLSVSEWSRGGRASMYDNATEHYEKHGSEVGAKSFDDYLRKASAFMRTVMDKGISGVFVSGRTDNVYRYSYNGRYIDLEFTAEANRIVSYGATKAGGKR